MKAKRKARKPTVVRRVETKTEGGGAMTIDDVRRLKLGHVVLTSRVDAQGKVIDCYWQPTESSVPMIFKREHLELLLEFVTHALEPERVGP